MANRRKGTKGCRTKASYKKAAKKAWNTRKRKYGAKGRKRKHNKKR